MRAGLSALAFAVVFGVAPAASAGVFPDLPGIDIAEKAIAGKSSGASTSFTSGASLEPARAPAMSSVTGSDDASTGLADAQTVDALPGGGLLNLGAASSAGGGATDGMVAALGLAVVVLFTRFLVRLNALGRRTT